MIVYEMGVRSFTADASSGLPEGRLGTFLGLKEKVQISCSKQIGLLLL
jgi:pullulanase/glycogen debranching enzyme